MFITLLIVTLLIALATSLLVLRLFDRLIRNILDRVVSAELSEAWNRYLSFAVVVVGVSGGVRINASGLGWGQQVQGKRRYLSAQRH